MTDFPLPLIGFAAYSGTGKTTLLLRLIPLLEARGLRLGVIKHAHHGFEPDQPGKDSYRLRKAGAQQMVVTSRERTAWIGEHPGERDEPTLGEALAALRPASLDLVLVEGFKHEHYPKIELHRAATGKPLIFPEDASVIAVASDGSLDTARLRGLPHLSIDDPPAIADFVLARIGWTGPVEGGPFSPR